MAHPNSQIRQTIERRVTVNDSGCWVWPTQQRYPQMKIDGKFCGVHRLSYESYNGPIGDAHVLHRCDNPRCVNPEHLFLGTHQDNMSDMVVKDRGGARNSGKLTDEQVREIWRKHERGFPVSWLAAEFGMSKAYMRDIVKRRVKNGYQTRHQAAR